MPSRIPVRRVVGRDSRFLPPSHSHTNRSQPTSGIPKASRRHVSSLMASRISFGSRQSLTFAGHPKILMPAQRLLLITDLVRAYPKGVLKLSSRNFWNSWAFVGLELTMTPQRTLAREWGSTH